MRTIGSRVAIAIVMAACSMSAMAATAVQTARPNVLVILTDDQGFGDFSLYGNPHLSTPRIDRLGRGSVRFDRFFVSTVCAPTRAALLTGRYPLRCGVWGVTHNKEAMRAEEVTLAEILRDAGYRTACIGKWHNGEQFPLTPPGQGFELFFGFHNGHINNYFDTELFRGAQAETTDGYITDVLTDEAIRFVRDRREQPFFCWLAFNAPHSPFQVPDKYFDRFKAKGFDDTVAAFYGMCENVDDNVGRLLLTLDESKLTENTIVVFLTDNGGTAGVKLFNAGMRGGKTSVHEGGGRVPCFIRWPKRLREPKLVPQIAAHIDLLPTLLDLCEIAPPANVELDGVSLRPLLEGNGQDWPERTLFTHNAISEANRYPAAVRTQQWRLVREIKGPMAGSRAKAADDTATAWQLYDMPADPGQERDVAAKHPQIVERLSRQYESWLDDVSSRGLKRLPIPVGHAEENPVTLHAPQAYFEGSLRFFAGPGFAHDWLTNWTDVKSRVWFVLDVAQAGDYEVSLRYSCPAEDAGSRIRLSVGEAFVEGHVPTAEAAVIPLPHRTSEKSQTYVNRRWGTLSLGTLALKPGPAKLTLEALDKPAGQVLELKDVVLRRRDH